jgi:hypothetical protein
MVSNLTATIVIRTLAGQFLGCLTIFSPDRCLKEGFIFFTLVIPGPRELKKQMNIFLQPLFEELKKLWQGVDAYDSHLRCRFTLRASYLWSIHDYLGYGKFVDWCVHDRLNYPICMDDSNAYRL